MNCDYCTHTFKTQETLNRHVKFVHITPPPPPPPATCNICGKTLNGRGFREHYQRCSKSTKHNCPYENCTWYSYNKKHVKRHIDNTHLGLKNHVCEQCGKQYLNAPSLKIHIRQHHTGERPYKCTTCGKDFASRLVWKNHQEIHLDVKLYSCEYCGKRFAQKVTLMTHIKGTHGGVRENT